MSGEMTSTRDSVREMSDIEIARDYGVTLRSYYLNIENGLKGQINGLQRLPVLEWIRKRTEQNELVCRKGGRTMSNNNETGMLSYTKVYQTMIEQAEQFGLENRLLQCTEEAGELIQALSKYQRILQGDKTCQTDMCHTEYMIAEEMADIEICIKQLKYLLGYTEELIEQIKAEKIERTEQRLLYGDTEEQRRE